MDKNELIVKQQLEMSFEKENVVKMKEQDVAFQEAIKTFDESSDSSAGDRFVTKEQMIEALQDAWNDFVGDTGYWQYNVYCACGTVGVKTQGTLSSHLKRGAKTCLACNVTKGRKRSYTLSHEYPRESEPNFATLKIRGFK